MATAPGSVTIGFDGSPDSRRAASWASALSASHGGLPLHLVHALSLPTVPTHYWELRVDELLDRHEQEARALLERERALLEGAGAGVEVFVRRWLPIETLLEHVRDHGSSLLVVGQHGHRPGRVLLGSVSSAVAREAEIPVVVVRGERSLVAPRTVLLAIDGSKPALSAAAAVARWFPAAHVRAVRIRNGSHDLELDQVARHLADAGIEPGRTEIRVGEGPPAEALLTLAEEADVDLVAAGRRGISAWRELLLGSVSEKLLQLAPCPVLVAH